MILNLPSNSITSITDIVGSVFSELGGVTAFVIGISAVFFIINKMIDMSADRLKAKYVATETDKMIWLDTEEYRQAKEDFEIEKGFEYERMLNVFEEEEE